VKPSASIPALDDEASGIHSNPFLKWAQPTLTFMARPFSLNAI
jgi:hypothetical protein